MPRKDKSQQSLPPSAPALVQDHASTPENNTGEHEDESIVTDTPSIIILHPGSSTLRLSLSNQLDPFYIPHVIAYRQTDSSDDCATPTMYTSTDSAHILKSSVDITEELSSQRDVGFDSIKETAAEARAANGVFDAESDTSQYSTLNLKSQLKPCVPDDEVSFQFTDLGTSPHFIIGNDAINLPPKAPYLVYKPLRYGGLNTGSGRSRTAVLKQLEDLWCRAIEECLDIPRKDFKFYRVVLLVPDMIDRPLYRDFMNVLLVQLEFDAVVVHQESVCATYGAGVSTACVVDVGEEKTHVCCVEDGMSNINTRVTLDYGGNDITRFFYWLLKNVKFPYKECTEDSMMDGFLIQRLKEKYCHFDMTVWGVAEEEVIIPFKGNGGCKFRIHFADELVYAPMSIFYPSCFCLPDNKALMHGQTIQREMGEDIYDELNWTNEQSQDKKGGGASSSKSSEKSSSATVATQQDTVLPEAVKRLKSIEEGRILALDQAVHFSIDCASSSEVKKKLYGSVLLIGGGLGFTQSSLILQSRLESSLPVEFSKGSDTVEVSSNPRDLSPQMVSWRGGAVLAMLDSCQELWIERNEWEMFGVRLLRERAPFVW